MDLTTRYMGLTLRNPIVASASPVNADLGMLRAIEDHGAGAVVLPAIFEEQILAERRELEARTHVPAIGFAEAQSYFPRYDGCGCGPERDLDLVRRAKDSVAIPVIASLNCITRDGWIEYAQAVQQAGADAIEIDVYCIPSDPEVSGRDVELRHLDILATVKAAISIPVAMKIGPHFSAVGNMARAFADRGASALVLFNRFYQPDIDIVTLSLTSELELSTPADIRLPLLWIGLLHGRVPCSLAASTGVDSADEVFKYLLAGADVVMTTSALLRHGVGHMGVLVEGLRRLLDARSIDRLDEVRGRMSRARLPEPAALERANHTRILHGYRIGS